MPNIIEKVKNALHSDTPDSHFQRPSSDVPGSFPDDRREYGTEQLSSKHRDGRDYIAPSGTHVGDHGLGRSSGDRVDPSMVGRSQAPQVDDRYLMDPADPRTGSNLMTTTGAGGDPETRLSDAGLSSGSQHNKLHKRDDPRAYETGRDYPETGQLGSRDHTGTTTGHGRDDLQTSGSLRRQEGQDNLLDRDRPSHHHGVGTAAGVGAAGVGAGALASQAIPERTHHSHGQQPVTDTSRTSHISGSRLSGDNHTYGQGVYNTVTGHGSGEDRLEDRRHAAPGETLHGTHGGTSAPAAAVAGAATAAGMHKASGHHDYAEAGRNVPTTATGSEGWPLGESTGATDRKPVGHSVRTTTTTNTNTSTYPPTTTTKYPDHTLDSRGPTSNFVGEAPPRLPEQSFDRSGQTSNVPGTTTTRHPDQALDSRGPTTTVPGTTTSRLPEQSYDSRGPTTAVPGTTTSRLPEQSYDSRGPTAPVPQTTTSRLPEQALDARGPTTGAPAPGPTSSNVGAAAPVGAAAGAATGASGDHYGPGHSGSKVLHQCKNCGHDNDISHYFRQGVSYRLE